jgi:hypothetical protein
MAIFDDLFLLRAFVSIVENGSISGAARSLRMAQPTLSRHLASLEEKCGLALLRRDTHTMSLTGCCRMPKRCSSWKSPNSAWVMNSRLSHVEHVVEGNIVYFVRLEGSFNLDHLRSALSRIQRKHPALRALIRQEPDGLYYEADSAPEIPLRIVPPRVTDDDYRCECQIELTTDFLYDQ